MIRLNSEAILQTLLHGTQLKQTSRTGWGQRGVPEAENVAAHSFGVGYTTLILALNLAEPIDLEKALTMAILHDLPESLTSDIPTTAWRRLPPSSKIGLERSALKEILEGLDRATELQALWEELTADQSPEANLVHDADKIDLYLQALVYEQQTANQRLQEFWDREPRLHFPLSQAIHAAIGARRSSR